MKIVLVFLIISNFASAQYYIERDVFGSCGMIDFQMNNKIVDYTVGEPITETFSIQVNNSTRYATQGFHQPGLFKYSINSTNSISGVGLDVLDFNGFILYPNPNNGIFILEIPDHNILNDITYHVFDQLGQIVQFGQLQTMSNIIKIDQIPGSYYLSLDNTEITMPFIIY